MIGDQIKQERPGLHERDAKGTNPQMAQRGTDKNSFCVNLWIGDVEHEEEP